jgi:hypothetical protein
MGMGPQIKGTREMLTFAPDDERLETLVIEMTPSEPNFQRLVDALKLMEAETGNPLNIEVFDNGSGAGFPIFPAIRRNSKTKSGHNFSQIIGINDIGYVNYIQVMGDRYNKGYKSFVEAVFDFAEYVLPSAPQPGSPRR